MRYRLKYLVADKDRYGKVRYYVRKPGKVKVRLTATPMSKEFMEQYREAFATAKAPPKPEIAKGTFRWLCTQYYASVKFAELDASTRNWHRRNLDEVCLTRGGNPVARMEPRHVRQLRNEKQRAAANMRMKALRSMFAWANEAGIFDGNPTIGVKNVQYVSKGHHSWTPEELEQYCERHPIGTQARLALDLLRFTAGRREDIPRLGPGNLSNGRIKFRQGKNEDRAPVDIDLPIHPTLIQSLHAADIGQKTFLITEAGKPFTTNGFGNKFKDWCRQAGLPHCSAHGVRKATSAALAEGGASPHEIMAITGHRSLKEVERYTKAASQKQMATSAMNKLK